MTCAPGATDETKRLFERMAPGSVAVCIRRNHQVPDQDGCFVYYEGGIHSRANSPPTEQERIEYAIAAARRAIEKYPTIARGYLRTQEGLEPAGYVDTETWDVVFNPPDQ